MGHSDGLGVPDFHAGRKDTHPAAAAAADCNVFLSHGTQLVPPLLLGHQ